MKLKRKNKPDLTTRNLKAAKKREATIKERVKRLEILVKALLRDVRFLLAKEQTKC